ALFGVNNLALRLPEIIGFWVMSVCLFIFVARRTSNPYGLVAATFPFVTGAYSYAYEARPYGLVLGLGALALVCWQAATTNRFRPLSLFCLAISLAAAISSHYYAVFILVPLALGEMVRTLTRRRMDVPLWAAFAVAVLPLILYLPLIKGARTYAATFWAPPHWLGIPEFYHNMLAPAVVPLVAILFLAGIQVTVPRSDTQMPGQAKRPALLFPEIAAAAGFIVIPVICVLLGKLVTGAFTDRYALPAIIGFSVLVAFAAARLFNNGALMASAVVICVVGWFGVLQIKAIRELSGDPVSTIVALLQSEGESNLPIVASEPHTFITVAHYAPPEIASRLVYLANIPASLRWLGHDSVERGMVDLLKPWFRLNVVDYESYVASQSRFLVYGNLGFLSWITQELKKDGRRIELRGRNGNDFLFLVYPGQQSASHSTTPTESVAELSPGLHSEIPGKR
nr:glycosyltransferase family 39 protein [Verrucomicrobiota bacterium]